MMTKHIRRRAPAVAALIFLVGVGCTPTPQGEGQSAPRQGAPSTPESLSGAFLLDLESGEQAALPANLARGSYYAASPDGTTLAFGTCCSGADVLTVANIDGTDARTLESPERLNYYGAQWSPDGTKIVYQERDGGDDDALTGDVGHSIMAAPPLSPPGASDLHQTLVEAKDSIWWPTMSPDGGKIAYQDGGSIYVVDFARDPGLAPESSKVADGELAEWLDDDTLIVVPS
jgi:dipeptidyl aminopeptidase/acylaminoacyl peptidase